MSAATAAPSASAGVLVLLGFYLVIILFEFIAMWRVFSKAHQPGWGVFIPIYNAYLLCKIARRPGWWTILLLIPFINIVMMLILALDIASVFSRSLAFGMGLWVLAPVFVLILAFGPSQYSGAPTFWST
jgi:hypothetical protein